MTVGRPLAKAPRPPKFRPCEMVHHFAAGELVEAKDECEICNLRLCSQCLERHTHGFIESHPDLAKCHFCGDENEKRDMRPDGCGGWTCGICERGMEETEND